MRIAPVQGGGARVFKVYQAYGDQHAMRRLLRSLLKVCVRQSRTRGGRVPLIFTSHGGRGEL